MKCKSDLIRVTAMSVMLLLALATGAHAQFNSGSDGHDGAFNPTADINIDMTDHPDGIYQYASVNIPAGVTVSFTPSAANAITPIPVVWLIQGDCVVAGTIDVSGKSANGTVGGAGGPGGWRGGNIDMPGLGPGGGDRGQSGSYGTTGCLEGWNRRGSESLYGNEYLIPLLGGSGGGGNTSVAGSGGGGAILIAASGQISLTGGIAANSGSWPTGGNWDSGLSDSSGSGGAVRLVSTIILGNGSVSCGGTSLAYSMFYGMGRARIEAYSDLYAGSCNVSLTRGMQNVLLLPDAPSPRLRVSSIGGVTAPATPSDSLPVPDVLLPSTLTGPLEVSLECQNMPLDTPITVMVSPQQGSTLSATATNSSGTFKASTASVSMDIPMGGGSISAKAVITIATGGSGLAKMSYRDTGLTTSGERFKLAELSTALGGRQQTTYVTESGKRVSLGAKTQ